MWKKNTNNHNDVYILEDSTESYNNQSNNNHYILRYTSTFYQHLNLYCSYINNDLPSKLDKNTFIIDELINIPLVNIL